MADAPQKPSIPDIRTGAISDEVLANLDPRTEAPALSNGYNLPTNFANDVSNLYHYLRGTTPTRVDPTAQEILAKAKNTYSISPTEERVFAEEYERASGAENATQRLIQALSQTKTRLPEAERAAAEEQRKREQAAAAARVAAPLPVAAPTVPVESEADKTARLAREAQEKQRAVTPPREAAPAIVPDPEAEKRAAALRSQQAAPPQPPAFYTYGELRSALRSRDLTNPIFQQISKEFEDTFNARAINIRNSQNETLIKKLNDNFEKDKKAFILDGVERMEREIGGMPDNMPSKRARITTSPVAAVPAVDPKEQERLRTEQERLERERKARETPVAPPVAGVPAVDPKEQERLKAERERAERERLAKVTPAAPPPIPAVIPPTVPAAIPESEKDYSRQYLPAFQASAPARAEQTVAPERAVLPVAQQRPQSVYDQFKENIARAVGNSGDADVYRAAETFGRAQTAALRGKGLHIPPEERKKFQEFLFDYGYYQGQRTREQFVDGNFGPETHLAARQLQKTTFEAQQQLSANGQGRKLKDGILGVETAKLFEQRATPPVSA